MASPPYKLPHNFQCEYCQDVFQKRARYLFGENDFSFMSVSHHPSFASLCNAAAANCPLCVLLCAAFTRQEIKKEKLEGVYFSCEMRRKNAYEMDYLMFIAAANQDDLPWGVQVELTTLQSMVLAALRRLNEN